MFAFIIPDPNRPFKLDKIVMYKNMGHKKIAFALNITLTDC